MLRHIALIAGSVDIVYLVVFAALGLPVIAAFNILSAAMYAAAWWLIGQRRNLPAVLLMWTEVLAHASTCTVLFGWDSGIHYYLLVFLPAVAISRSAKVAALSMAFILAWYLGLDFVTHATPPTYPLSLGVLLGLRWLSIGVVFLMFGDMGRYYVRHVAESERRLRDMATTDPLTGLFNRRHFMAQVDQEIAKARRNGRPLALAIADIDHFKRINDSFGHMAGDEAIVHVSRCLAGAVRPGDIVGRWGGEEFVVLFPDTDLQAAAGVCERLRAALEQAPCPATGQELRLTASFGVQVVSLADGPELAANAADRALYSAKRAGRNQVAVAA